MDQILLCVVLLLVVVSALVTAIDPRRFQCAVWWGITVNVAFLAVAWAVTAWVTDNADGTAGGWVILGMAGGVLVAILYAAILLMFEGVRLIRREGFSLSHSLALLLGLGASGYLVGLAVLVSLELLRPAVFLGLLGLPLAYFAFLLLCFVVYANAYNWWACRWARPGRLIVVLGSGLIGGEVPPLLRARLDLGCEQYQRSCADGLAPLMVASGGQGADESRSEGAAMVEYLKHQDIPSVDLLAETRSASTEENLLLTARLVGPKVASHRWMIATSDYHAFRAAMLARQLGLKGQAVGARTPTYFRSSAMLREFVAVIREHWALNVTMTVLLVIPLLLALLAAYIG